MWYRMPVWLKNTVLLLVLFLLFLWMQQTAEAPRRSIVDFSYALGELNLPPRDGSPFVVPASGPVMFRGKEVRCPFTGSRFVWMGVTRDGEQLVITQDGGEDYRVFAGSEKPNANGTRTLAISGIKGGDPGVRIQQAHDLQVDWKTQRWIPFGARKD